jgi:hypothetical protein
VINPLIGIPSYIIDRCPQIALKEQPLERVLDESFAMTGKESIQAIDCSAVRFAFKKMKRSERERTTLLRCTAMPQERICRVYVLASVRSSTNEQGFMQAIPPVAWIGRIWRKLISGGRGFFFVREGFGGEQPAHTADGQYRADPPMAHDRTFLFCISQPRRAQNCPN